VKKAHHFQFLSSFETADLEEIQKTLKLKAVGERLTQIGLTREEIRVKLAQLNDQRVYRLTVELDQIKPESRRN